jgi:hypothetical protein
MPQDPTQTPQTPVEKDAEQPVSGRQPQRPGQHGQYQPRPGERAPDTLPSREPEGFAGDPPARGAMPTAQNPRLGLPDEPED